MSMCIPQSAEATLATPKTPATVKTAKTFLLTSNSPFSKASLSGEAAACVRADDAEAAAACVPALRVLRAAQNSSVLVLQVLPVQVSALREIPRDDVAAVEVAEAYEAGACASAAQVCSVFRLP